MSGVIPQLVDMFFEFCSKDTVAEGAKLEIEVDPAVYECLDCGAVSEYADFAENYVCKSCGSKELRLKSGYGMQIVSAAII
jgi:hydrogenase nickel incorporation protein HypA/HybF